MTDRRHIECCPQPPLRPQTRRDYGPNGLPPAGARAVRRVALSVAARLRPAHEFPDLESIE